MNIWIIKIGDPPLLDKGERLWRSNSIAVEMANANHNVTLWNSSFNHYQKTFVAKDTLITNVRKNLKLIFIKSIGYSTNVSFRRLLDYKLTAKKFLALAENQPKPDLILTAVPSHNFAFRTAQFAKKHNIQLIVDISDLWPDVYLTIFRNKLLKKAVKKLLFFEYKKLEFACKNTSNIVAISETYMKYGLEHGKRVQNVNDRIFYLGSTAIKGVNHESIQYIDGIKEIIYVGSFGKTYELDLIIKMAQHFSESKIKNVKFVLIGDGEQYFNLNEKAKKLDNVELTGWLEISEIHVRMKTAYLGIVPYITGASQCLPYKAFDYLSAGLPLVNSLINTDMENIIRDHKLGLSYNPGDLKTLIKHCVYFIEHPLERNKAANNVLNFFQKQGDSELIYKNYRLYLESLTDNNPNS